MNILDKILQKQTNNTSITEALTKKANNIEKYYYLLIVVALVLSLFFFAFMDNNLKIIADNVVSVTNLELKDTNNKLKSMANIIENTNFSDLDIQEFHDNDYFDYLYLFSKDKTIIKRQAINKNAKEQSLKNALKEEVFLENSLKKSKKGNFQIYYNSENNDKIFFITKIKHHELYSYVAARIDRIKRNNINNFINKIEDLNFYFFNYSGNIIFKKANKDKSDEKNLFSYTKFFPKFNNKDGYHLTYHENCYYLSYVRYLENYPVVLLIQQPVLYILFLLIYPLLIFIIPLFIIKYFARDLKKYINEVVVFPILNITNMIYSYRKDKKTHFKETGTHELKIFSAALKTISNELLDAKINLFQSESRFQSLFEHSNSIMIIADAYTGDIIYANRAASEFYGYSIKALEKMNVFDFNALSPEEKAMQKLISIQERTNYYYSKHRIINGQIREVQIQENIILDVDYAFHFYIISDITQTKRKEQNLITQKEYFSSGPLLIIIWANLESWTILKVSDNCKNILGYEEDDLVDRDFNYVDLIHPKDLNNVYKAVNYFLTNNHNHFDIEYRIRKADKCYGWFHFYIKVIRDDEGNIANYMGHILENTKQKELELKIKNEKERLSNIFWAINVGSWEYNIKTKSVIVNDNWLEMIGYTQKDMIITDLQSWGNLIHGEDLHYFYSSLEKHINGESETFSIEIRLKHKDTNYIWVSIKGKNIAKEGDKKSNWIAGIQSEITSKKESEIQLQLLASVFSYAREGISITDLKGNIVDVNEAFEQITGYTKDEAIGKNPNILKSGRHTDAFYQNMWDSIITKGSWKGEIWNRRKNGEVYPEILTISVVKNELDEVTNYVALFSDISTIKEQQEQLEYLAHHDALTRLPNRVLLTDRLHQAMNIARRQNKKLAVVYFDLDGFKPINDNYGHKAGDLLLIELSRRLKAALREEDTVARIGGDEFAAVLVDIKNDQDTITMLNRLLAIINKEVAIDDENRVHVSASVGVTFYPQNEEIEADQLLRQADLAMYQAKLEGKNRYSFFDLEEDKSIRGFHESIDRVSEALRNDEFLLYYQPKVDLSQGKVVGVEALIRWRHPQSGILTPGHFLPSVENNLITEQIDIWVIKEALNQLKIFKDLSLDIKISVNISARFLQRIDMIQIVREALEDKFWYKDGDLMFEILETSAIDDIEQTMQKITECKKLGITFALDDFGTGYSSLSYFKRLPIDELKIDQSFVRDMLEDADDLAILESIINISNTFGRKVIAEGVETKEHIELLIRLGCILAQGYAIARPMPSYAFLLWHRSWQASPLWKKINPARKNILTLYYISIEHRGWMKSIQTHIENKTNAIFDFNGYLHSLEKWKKQMQSLANEVENIQSLIKLHIDIYNLGIELVRLYDQGHEDSVVIRVNKFTRYKNILLQVLK